MFTLDQEPYAKMIAEFSGLPLNAVDPAEVRALYEDPEITRGKATYEMLRKYVGQDLSHQPRYERHTMLLHRAEGLFNLDAYWRSYGVFAPSYLDLLRDSITDPAQPHRALLVGALTVDTITEFAALVKLLFPKSTREVVDIYKFSVPVPEGTATVGYGDGLHLRKFETYDSIHTNFLLAELASGSTGMKEGFEGRYALFNGASSALRPGGRLVMVESIPTLDLRWEEITTDLEDSGFKDVRILPALAFKRRRSVFEYTKQPTLSIHPKLVYDRSSGIIQNVEEKAIRATRA